MNIFLVENGVIIDGVGVSLARVNIPCKAFFDLNIQSHASEFITSNGNCTCLGIYRKSCFYSGYRNHFGKTNAT